MRKWEIVLAFLTILIIILALTLLVIRSIKDDYVINENPKMLIATVKHPDGSTFNLELDYYVLKSDATIYLKCLDGTEYLTGAENVLIVER